ncbi:MAG: PAS domain-containing protein [Alphaproteobacteria bacterium]|nr:PAS domain-containing protein [Alphaproteobacteria bacterium]
MPNSDVSARPLVLAALALALPFLVAMLALAAIEGIGIGAIVATWIAGSLAMAAIVARHLRQLRALRRQIELGERPSEPDSILADLVEAAARLARENQELEARAVASARAREAMLDAVPEPVLLLARDGRVAVVNQAARDLLGIDCAGRDLAEVLRYPQVLQAASAVLVDGRARAVEAALVAPAPRNLDVRIAPLPGLAPEDGAALVMLGDLTAIRRAERTRADFIANVSHELRTPLASIIGFIETLRGPAQDDAPARAQFLEIMDQQAQRMARLVADLLSLARIEQNEHTPPTGRIAILPLLGTVKDALAPAAQRRDMAIAIDAAPDLPDIAGETDEVAQVFQNLIDNALKYGRTGTTVTVRASIADDPPPAFPHPPGTRPRVLAVAVRDVSAGIAPEYLPRLTERFYRIDVARSRDAGGTGLGLAIVKHILGRHRGTLTIESEVGRGSTFTAYLPLAPDKKPSTS